MKKLGITLLAAIVGGMIAVGVFKLFENKQMDNMTFEERQNVYYANNPDGEVRSSTGNPDRSRGCGISRSGSCSGDHERERVTG